MKRAFVIFVLSTLCAGLPAHAGETWGGKHVSLSVDDQGSATLRFDCASGSAERSWIVYRGGTVNAAGLYQRELQDSPGDGPSPEKVHYVARIQGNAMKLWIRYSNGAYSGSFKLKKGAKAELFPCLR